MLMLLWEENLKNKGIAFEYLPEIRRVDLVRKEQTRLDIRGTAKADEERMLEMAVHLENGGTVPPFFIERSSDGKLSLIDGFHRDGALELRGVASHDAYLVKFSDELQREGFLASVNIWTNGKEPDRDHRLHRAVSLMNRYKVPAKEAAANQQLPERTVAKAYRIQEIRRRLAELGFDADKSGFTDAHLATVGSIQSDAVLTAAVKAFQKTKATVDVAKILIPSVNKARSEKLALETIEEWVKKRAGLPEPLAKRPSGAKRPARLVLRAIGVFDFAKRRIAQCLADQGRTMTAEEIQVLMTQTDDLLIEVQRLKRALPKWSLDAQKTRPRKKGRNNR